MGVGGIAAVFPVQGPGQGRLGSDPEICGAQLRHHTAGVSCSALHQVSEDALELGGILGEADEDHFKQAVVQRDIVPSALEASHRDGVAHHAVDKIPLFPARVGLHRQVVGVEVGQTSGPLQHIGQMAEEVFEGLGGVVGHVGKGAEGGHIDKILVVEAAHIHQSGTTGGGGLRPGVHPPGKAEVTGKVVGGTGGDIAYFGAVLQGHQAGNDFVKGAVSAAADHPVHTAAQFSGGSGGVAGTLGGMGDDEPPGPGEGVLKAGKTGFDPAFSSVGIVDKEHTAHEASSFYQDVILNSIIIPCFSPKTTAP